MNTIDDGPDRFEDWPDLQKAFRRMHAQDGTDHIGPALGPKAGPRFVEDRDETGFTNIQPLSDKEDKEATRMQIEKALGS